MVMGHKTLKICLTNQGKDVETPWAEDLGPSPRGGRLARLINVPFLHAKPTWGDTVEVLPSADDGFPTWDRSGVPFHKVHTRIAADSGRWAMIVDYAPHPDAPADANEIFATLARACAEHDIVCEGAWTPRDDGDPGRVYFAVPGALGDRDVLRLLGAASLPCDLVQIHPAPAPRAAKPKRAATKPSGRAKKPSPAKPAATKKRAATKPTKTPAQKSPIKKRTK